MNWHRLTVAGAILTSMVFPIATMGEALAQSSTLQCVMVTPRGEHILLSDSDACRNSAVEVVPVAQPAPVVQAVVDPEDHNFELFNNSDQNIQYLHLFPDSAPTDVKVYGGSRSLAPGRAWSVNLSQGCEYSVLVEYKDGSRDYYENIDTCAHRGIQLQ